MARTTSEPPGDDAGHPNGRTARAPASPPSTASARVAAAGAAMTGTIKWFLYAAAAGPVALAVAVTLLVGMGDDTAAGCRTSDALAAGAAPGSTAGAQPSAPIPSAAGAAPGSAATDSIPRNYLEAYQAAGQAFGLPWTLLAGVGKVESDHGRSTLPGIASGANYAGARGPMQFLTGWDTYGVDGDGDGVTDVYNPTDAIAGAANYLRVSGAPRDVRGALSHYNHSTAYADQVLSWAAKYGGGVTTTAEVGAACTPGGPLPAGPYGTRIVAAATRWLGTPYLWGGGNTRGPTTGCGHGICVHSPGGFDCSGLTLYAVYQATGGKISLPHLAAAQYADRRLKPVPADQLQPGDLVFFHNLGHVGIYVGDNKMINAPQTGERIKSAAIGPGTSYHASYVGARRITGGTSP